MSHRFKTVVDEVNCLANKDTGEINDYYLHIKLHNYENFFIAAFAAWDDFKMTDGVKVRVFIHCILVSSPSRLPKEEGNFFHVSDLYSSIKSSFPGMSEVGIRQNVSKLAKDGFIWKTKTRGRYMINPKYGVKGVFSEKSYARLVVDKPSFPEREFGKGNEQT